MKNLYLFVTFFTVKYSCLRASTGFPLRFSFTTYLLCYVYYLYLKLRIKRYSNANWCYTIYWPQFSKDLHKMAHDNNILRNSCLASYVKKLLGNIFVFQMKNCVKSWLLFVKVDVEENVLAWISNKYLFKFRQTGLERVYRCQIKMLFLRHSEWWFLQYVVVGS